MKLEKDTLITCMQCCINSFNGQWGPVIAVLDKEKPFTLKEGGYSVEGIIGEKDGVLYIIFQGTCGILEWIYNFEFWQQTIPYDGTNPSIKVHKTFIEEYRCVRSFIHHTMIEFINRPQSPKKVIVTGHSLGGALATLCALDIQYNFTNAGIDVAMANFGSPRVGNRAFAASYNSRITDSYRIVNADDIVTKVPWPQSFFFRYAHVNRLVKTGKSSGKFSAIKRITGNPDDHFPLQYLESLKKADI